jgi:uncharacterized protein (TIGR04255 family)
MNYKNSPIKEAVFDIKIEPLVGFEVSTFNIVYEKFKELYPQVKTKYRLKSSISIMPDQTVEREEDPVSAFGYFYTNEQKTKTIQFRLDGFSLNYLEPYTNWEEFHEEAITYWKIYSEFITSTRTMPPQIDRIALRYVNRINIPLPFDYFNDYIVNMPPIPDCLPQTFRNFFMQIDVPSENGLNVLITETIDDASETNLPFILDIDVSKTVEDNNFDIVKDFDEMRIMKNMIFEASVTDKTKQLFS